MLGPVISLYGSQGIATLYKSWIRLVLEYNSILYSGAALTHLNCLDYFQTRVGNMCGFIKYMQHTVIDAWCQKVFGLYK